MIFAGTRLQHRGRLISGLMKLTSDLLRHRPFSPLITSQVTRSKSSAVAGEAAAGGPEVWERRPWPERDPVPMWPEKREPDHEEARDG